MNTLLTWAVGIIWIGGTLTALLLLHEDGPKRLLLLGFGIGLAGIILGVSFGGRDIFFLYLEVFLIGVGLLFSTFMLRSPLRKAHIYRIGSDLGKETLPEESKQLIENALEHPPASLAFWIALVLRPFNANSPPLGYWAIIYPNRMFIDQDYTLRINFPPLESRDPMLQKVREFLKEGKGTTLSIRPLAGESFKIVPDKREVVIPTQHRLLPMEFFVTPTRVGKRKLRLEVYIGDGIVGWFDETIRVKRTIDKWIILVASILGIIGAIVGIIKALG